MSRTWNDPRAIWGAPIKAEGSAVGDSLVYKSAGRYVDPYREQFDRIEYILQRTVPDYDELVKQYNAIKDIERSNNDIR
jgi:hypothetical protein